MEGGKTANYWPGFVDALTNVVIAMVFVIVVLAIALSFSAQLLAKRMAARITVLEQQGQAAQAQTAASAPELIVKRLAPSRQPSVEATPSTSIESADGVLQVESKMAAPVRIAVKGNEEQLVAAGGPKANDAEAKAELENCQALFKQRQRDLDLIQRGGEGDAFKPAPKPIPEYVKPSWQAEK